MRSASEGLIDLEELILACRSEEAGVYMQEAVGCYKSGSYRSCIVATWIAVVYDIANKLRELYRAGDKAARTHFEEFQRIHDEGDIEGALRFERELLSVAQDQFELLTSIERADLERLHEDRHRCAHPSMIGVDEPYVPTAETARYHMHNAVHHLLQREPVQGKSAFERVMADIRSEYFPEGGQEAISLLKEGPLASARQSLVRNVVVVLCKDLLLEGQSKGGWHRLAAALKAIHSMAPELYEAAVQKKVRHIVARVEDENWGRVIAFARRVPFGWESLRSYRIKAKEYVERLNLEVHDHDMPPILSFTRVEPAIVEAYQINDLKGIVDRRASEFTEDGLSAMIDRFGSIELFEEGISRIRDSDHYTIAGNRVVSFVRPHLENIGPDQVVQVIEAFLSNDWVFKSYKATPVMAEVLQASEPFLNALEDIWKRVFDMISSAEREHMSGLKESIQEEYPSFADDDLPF